MIFPKTVAIVFVLGSAAAQTDKITDRLSKLEVRTPHGMFIITTLEVIRAERDRPCGVSMYVENLTPTTWSEAVVNVTLLSKKQSVTVAEVKANYIGRDGRYHLFGKCSFDDPSRPPVDDVAIKLIEGKPDPELLRISRLPVLSIGDSDTAFVAVDRKCAEDFQAAIAKGGLEGRKMMQGLLEYKCGVVVGTPVHVNVPQHDGQWARITIPDGPDLGKSGWVPAAWLLGELAGK